MKRFPQCSHFSDEHFRELQKLTSCDLAEEVTENRGNVSGNGSKCFTFSKKTKQNRVLKHKKSRRIQRQRSLRSLPKKIEWGIKELSWAEPGRRVGHKKLRGGKEGGGGGGG